MRQYTDNSPGCITAKYINIGSRRQYTTDWALEAPSCQMNRNWLYGYRNWLYWYRNWVVRYTDCSTPFAVNQSLTRVYAIADTHREFFMFSFPRNQNQHIFFEPCRVPAVFPVINFSLWWQLFLWSIFKTSFYWHLERSSESHYDYESEEQQIPWYLWYHE